MPATRNALHIIHELWGALGLNAPAVELLAPEELPPAFRTLLVHQAGMTATLEQHWRESICVELLSDDISLEQRTLFRFVVLRTRSSAESVEIALIRIPLDVFPATLRQRFIQAERPFGTLLAEAGIRFQARPEAYFTFVGDAALAERCAISDGTRLYGRVSQLLRDDGVLLCETIEALPRA